MSSGAHHYREAERLLAIVDDNLAGDTMLTVPELLAAAQLHATLALAAATALDALKEWTASQADTDCCEAEARRWFDVVGGEA